MKPALIIFARNPEAGDVKTRLAATIGNHAAIAVYHQLVHCTVSATHHLPVDKIVFYSNYIQQEDKWDNRYYTKELQQGIDLGERMKNAFASTFQKGYDQLAIIGTDCPDLTAEIIMDAFAALQSNDLAIGPAEDGGYYLLAMNNLHKELFEGIKWSTNTVLNDTLGKCATLQLSHNLLPLLNDIDDEQDLRASKLYNQ